MSGKGWERRRKDDRSEWGEAYSEGVHMSVWVVMVLALLIGGGYGITYILLPAERAIRTEQEDIRRDVYEHSKSYTDGTIRDLENIRLQWIQADDDVARIALEKTALHRAADFPTDELPEHLRAWIAEIRP